MKNTSLKAVLAMIVLFCSVSITQAQSDAELKQKIEKINKDMAKAMIDGNFDANMAYYSPDVISMPANQKMLNGINEIKKSHDEMVKEGWKFKDFKTEIKEVSSHGDIVTEIGTYQAAFTMQGMEKELKDEGKYLTLWEKQADGSLRVKAEIWNSDKNPMDDRMAAGDNEDE